jgi:putative glutamine amidotransferase
MKNLKTLLCAAVLPILLGTSLSRAAEKPRIGLLYAAKNAADLEANGPDILINYRRALERNGAETVVLDPAQSPAELASRLETLDGLLIPGGDDIDPALYGAKPDPLLESFDTSFDRFELDMVGRAREKKLPVLGICRGHQLLNVSRGGSLVQDIPTRFPTKTPVVHRKKVDGKAVPVYHDITLKKKSVLENLFGKDRLTVNSYHHQAVGRLGRGLTAVAWSDDGSVEAIEETAPHSPFYLGIQFHPEKMHDEAPQMDRIFQAFIAAAAKPR